MARKPKRRSELLPDRRPSAAQRGYDSRWRKRRNAKILRDPWCEICLARGQWTPAQEVHHVLPLSKGGTHAWENLQSLCVLCHHRVTISDKRDGEWPS